MSNTRTDCVHRVRRVITFNEMDDMIKFIWWEGSNIHNLQNRSMFEGESRGYKNHYQISFTIMLIDWNELCIRWNMTDVKTRLNKFWKCNGSV